MANNIRVETVKEIPIEKRKIEIVERKGLGHPDYIADSVAESFSRSLSKYYIEKFGSVLHHNVDKLEVIGGQTVPEFGGGKIIKPISILFSGRATDEADGQNVPVKEIAIESAKSWLSSNIRFIDVDNVRFIFETKSGSENLSDAFKRNGKIGSNDTSFGVGYAPLSETESLVMSLERFLNSKEFKKTHSFSGEDVKVMGVRKKDNIDVTIAMAFVDKFVDSTGEYFEKKEIILNELKERFSLTRMGRKVKLTLNGMDNKRRGKSGCYLTVTGSSSEHGDDGAVGRGNRVNGLITPCRPMSLEAAAGKNPVNHIGKIYNLFSFKLANELNSKFGYDFSIKMVGRIGSPLDEPVILSVQTTDRIDKNKKSEISLFVKEMLENIEQMKDEILNNKFGVC